MKLFDADKFSEIVQSITKNKTRSFLTAFGVFWGIFMLIALIGGGNGLEFMLKKEIAGVETNSAFLFTNRTGEAYQGFQKGRRWQMKFSDVAVLKSQIPEIQDISAILFGNGDVVRGEHSESFSVKGFTPEYLNINHSNVFMGRHINDMDIQENRKVCVIGEQVYESLFFRGEDPIGTYLRVNSIYYQVIGVCRPLSSGMNVGGDDKETIVLPMNVMRQTFHLGDVVHMIAFTTVRGYSVADISSDVERIIKQLHKISPTDKKALDVFDLEKQFKIFDNLFVGINILIWIVGLGTLLAGIIGVSNIMMVTVNERTQEIGVRRALGAKPYQIIVQILSETALLTSIAGILGIAFGVLVLQVVDTAMSGGGGETGGFMAPFWTALGAAVVLLFLSLLAGLAPAWRAMQIKAIDALREE
ncbi:ABC transporter ATP-binding protein [Bacteroidia bacterium]|nr:ABC transporter ATP-binding protein [Bacteroidia bacterium]